jgi:hypothetical protein
MSYKDRIPQAACYVKVTIPLEIGDAAWQGAPLGAVAAGLGLTLAEMLRRYLRARRVYERTAG